VSTVRWFVILAAMAARVSAQDFGVELPADVKKALQRHVGTWDFESVMAPTANVPQGAKAKGTSVIDWALDGRFLRSVGTGTNTIGDREVKLAVEVILTYDPRAKVYRKWTFWSQSDKNGRTGFWGGPSFAVEMTWDEASQTFAATGSDAGTTLKGTVKFKDDDTMEMKNVLTDKNGTVLQDQTAVFKRRK